MKKAILIYGLAIALLLVLLQVLEYNYLIRAFSFEIYAGLLGVVFMAAGIWFGLKLQARQKQQPQLLEDNFEADPQLLEKLGITNREYEVLLLLAQGHSNQEIADKLFVSIHTIKTHTTNLYTKLDVKRRTQAVQEARRLQLLPQNQL